MADRFEKHARTVTLLTLLSRVTGLARDAALARIFGVSALMDAFWFAFMVPNLFRRLFGEGALSAAFLPVYALLNRDDPVRARQLATLTLSLLLVALGGLTIIGEVILLMLHARAAEPNLAVELMMVMLPYAPLVCTVAIFGAMLQVHGRFGPTAAAPIVLNAFLVAASWGLAGRFDESGTGGEIAHLRVVAASVILAGLVQMAWSLWSLRVVSWWAGGMARCAPAWPAMKTMLRQVWPMLLGLGVLQINVFMDDLIASYPTTIGPTIFGWPFPLERGALTVINAAQRLYEFPLGVFGIAVATAIFPSLARAGSNEAAFADLLRRGLRLVVFIGLPASVGLMLVRVPLTAAVYQGGDFTAADTQRVAFVLLGYAPAIWAYSMTHTMTRAFYARGDSMTPVKVAVGMVALNFTLNISLIWTPLKEAGLAWSTATCALVQVMILLRLARGHAAHLVDRAVVMSWIRTLVVTALMGAAVWLATMLLPAREATWSAAMIALGALVFAGGAAAVVASLALRMPELSWALGRSAGGQETT